MRRAIVSVLVEVEVNALQWAALLGQPGSHQPFGILQQRVCIHVEPVRGDQRARASEAKLLARGRHRIGEDGEQIVCPRR
ncbi:MAG: hypothetical protein R2701_02055 [Acidimicrobiales bacterium]